MTTYYRKAWAIEAWAYDAAIHCNSCAIARFGREALADDTAEDSEGNKVHPVFASDEMEEGTACDSCGILIDDTATF